MLLALLLLVLAEWVHCSACTAQIIDRFRGVSWDQRPVFDSQVKPVLLEQPSLTESIALEDSLASWHSAPSRLCSYTRGIAGDLVCDGRNWVTKRHLVEYTAVLGVAAAFANTSIDEDFRQWARRQGLTQPAASCPFSDLGKAEYVVPALALGTIVSWACERRACTRGSLCCRNVAGVAKTWSYRSTRSLLVGAPALILTQSITGASRPGENPAGSGWKPFDDDNGASGHAFIGAVPFLVAAEMTDRPVLKGALVVGSGIAGYSRICTDSHYLSQVILGWTIAHISVRSVTDTDLGCHEARLVPVNIYGIQGIGIQFRR
ncbi:MAG: phosphatase PAP2 family protein [Pirellulaceae bacterium]